MAGEDPFQTPVILGREDVRRELERAIAGDGPAALVLTGEAGTGKSTLVGAAALRFAARDGHVGPVVGAGPDATTQSFSEAVRTAYRLPAPPALPRPHDMSPTALGDVPVEPRAEPDQPLVAALAHKYERVLVRVDDYDPTAEFAAWFDERFLRSALASDTAIVVLVAARPDALPVKTARTVHVEPLRRDDVAGHFRRIGRLLAPPAEDPEVQAWVDAAVADPERIDRLTRALSLVRRPSEAA